MNLYLFLDSQTQPLTQVNWYTGDGTLQYWDPLTIYDGSNDQSSQIAKLSGNLGNFSISSTGTSLFVKFESDGHGDSNDDNYSGFFATVTYGNPLFE